MTDKTPLGWPVLDAGSPTLYTWTIPGTTLRITMRAGTAGFVLACWIVLWHRTVERLVSKDCGAYNKRKVTGGNVWSEHAAGTAVDLHWSKHPYGVAPGRTFTRVQIDMIHRRIKWWNRLAGATVIRWGGDYLTDPDGMHTELYYRLRALKRLAAILKRTSVGREVIHANPAQARFL